MADVEVELGRLWSKESEEAIMQRVADVVVGRNARQQPYRQEAGYDWALDDSNSWKAQIRDGRLFVSYRYARPEVMEGLESVLAWLFRR